MTQKLETTYSVLRVFHHPGAQATTTRCPTRYLLRRRKNIVPAAATLFQRQFHVVGDRPVKLSKLLVKLTAGLAVTFDGCRTKPGKRLTRVFQHTVKRGRKLGSVSEDPLSSTPTAPDWP